MKQTHALERLMQILNEAKHPVAVDEIVAKVKVNKTTVYRQFDKLVLGGQVVQVDVLDGKKRYEMVTKGHHHHVMCEKCHTIECARVVENLTTLERTVATNTGYKITRHALEFFGLCRKCV